MAYEPTIWQDHVTEYENRYTEVQNEDGTVTHNPVEGEIIQQGTPLSATNFNHMEEGIVNATELGEETADKVQNLEWITIEKTLINSQDYPFNNSKQTVALPQSRNQLEYTVTAEVLSYSGGFPGDIEISDKLQNGFKVAFTGSAKSVTVKLYVKGGYIYDSGNN